MFVYAITEGDLDNANEILLTHKSEFKKKEFQKIYNEACSKIKKKGKSVTGERIANYMVKREGFNHLQVSMGVWAKGFKFKKVSDDDFVKRDTVKGGFFVI